MTCRGVITFAVLLLASLPGAMASAQEGAPGTRWTVEIGPRGESSNLVWNNGPSELDYHGLRGAGVGGRLRAFVGARGRASLYLVGSGARTRVEAGQARDSDWNHQGVEYSRSLSAVTGDRSKTLAAGGMLRVDLSHRAPLRHLSIRVMRRRDETSLRKRDGEQVIPEGASDTILAGLDSRYRARWKGLALEGEVAFSMGEGSVTLGATGLPSVDFRGTGKWNLREDLAQPVSFVQEGNARAAGGTVRYERPLGGRWLLAAEAGILRRTLRFGRDTLLLADGGKLEGALRSARQNDRGLEVRVVRDLSWN